VLLSLAQRDAWSVVRWYGGAAWVGVGVLDAGLSLGALVFLIGPPGPPGPRNDVVVGVTGTCVPLSLPVDPWNATSIPWLGACGSRVESVLPQPGTLRCCNPC
jgi:hypothetical protein